MNAVDTNVFVYALDDTEAAKQAKAQELIGGLVQPPVQTVMLWQVAGELLSCLRKMGIRQPHHASRRGATFSRYSCLISLENPERQSVRNSVRPARAFQPIALGQYVVGRL